VTRVRASRAARRRPVAVEVMGSVLVATGTWGPGGGVLVPGAPVQQPPAGGGGGAAPLLEEERHPGGAGLVAQPADPARVDRAPAGAALAAADDPVDGWLAASPAQQPPELGDRLPVPSSSGPPDRAQTGRKGGSQRLRSRPPQADEVL
jgi:hypothetical protein